MYGSDREHCPTDTDVKKTFVERILMIDVEPNKNFFEKEPFIYNLFILHRKCPSTPLCYGELIVPGGGLVSIVPVQTGHH